MTAVFSPEGTTSGGDAVGESVWIAVQNSLRLLSRRDQWKVGLATAGQALLSFMDLAAVIALGSVAAVATALATGTAPTGTLSSVAGWVPANATGLVVVGAVAGLTLVLKSILSLFTTRRIFRFLAAKQAVVADQLATALFQQPLRQLTARSSQEVVFALTSGVNAVTNGTLGPAVVVVAEASLALVMFIGIALMDIGVAVFMLAFFGLLVVFLHFALGRWATSLGALQSRAEIESTETIQQLLLVFRELAVLERREQFLVRFRQQRSGAASVVADLYILSQAGKYAFEIGLVLGAGILSLIVARTQGLVGAAATVTVFLLATSRVFPALIRMQSSLSIIRTSASYSGPTLALAGRLAGELLTRDSAQTDGAGSAAFAAEVAIGFRGIVSARDLWFTYDGTSVPALAGVSFELPEGQSMSIIGASGAGKSTLADVILGLAPASRGSIVISGLAPSLARAQWPGAISYVPQETFIIRGTVADNVALGVPSEDVDYDRIWEALERAHLADFLRTDRVGADTQLGEHGVQLSGGQRQRLGLARALYSRPRLMVLDEATSALDASTELAVAETLDSLKGDLTLITIAHRLATAKRSDLVLYLENGFPRALGDFGAVRAQVPELDRQLHLLGIS